MTQDSISLSGAEKKKLRGFAQTIDTKIHIGRETTIEAITQQLALAFKHEDLIKVRFHTPDRKAIMKLCAEIESATGTLCVAQVGKTAAFFNPVQVSEN